MTLSFHDMQFDLAEERIEALRQGADHHRLVSASRRARSRRRLGFLRRVMAPRLTATVQGINDLLGAIISPAWPAREPPMPPMRQSLGR
jgi:hypothetical protein